METLHSNPGLEHLRQDFLLTGDAFRVLRGRTGQVDGMVARAHDEFLAPAFPSGMAVVAVGGFGRRELFPYSDVDLILLMEREPRSKSARDALVDFSGSLWDRGLRLSYSVRTPSECCELYDGNVELSVSLLNQRFLAGDRSLYEKLRAGLPKFLHGERDNLARHFCRLTRARHAKYQDTIYHLEPNVKETPGGLRDFQFVCWLSQLRNAGPDRLPASDRFDELEAAWRFLSSVRCYLHFQARRDHNLLTFDAQEEAAELPFFRAQPAAWMRDYFRHARDIHRTTTRWLETSEAPHSSLFSQFKDWRSRLSNSEFTVSRERVYFKAPQQLEREPELVLRLFQFVARHGIRPAFESGKRIAGHLAAISEYFSASRPVWPAIEEVLSLPYAALALESMHETGVLKALFPEWADIECLVIRDFYHRYTVDEHTLVSIRLLNGLPQSGDALLRRFAALYQEIERPAVLLFALLFHDTGKGVAAGSHVSESARLAEQAMERTQTPIAQRETVKFLIEKHLDLSRVMNSRDPDEPSTAEFLAERTGTLEHLKDLALMTYADISAVNPAAMTPWRLEQLWSVYLITYNELTRKLDTARIKAPAAGSPEKAAFLEGFPTRYLRTHSEAGIEAHFELYRRAGDSGGAVEISKWNGFYRLTLVTRDRPRLLAAVAGALAGFGMNILKAEAFGNNRGTVLDTFIFSDPHRTLELNPAEMDRFRLTVERAVQGKLDVKRLLQNRPKPAPPSKRSRIRPSVSFNSEASATSTLIEIIAQDRAGLLYDLASAISSAGCNIEVVLIDTEAHKALDVFYVTKGGGKLAAADQMLLGQSLLAVCEPQGS